jgi:hypothetical protein
MEILRGVLYSKIYNKKILLIQPGVGISSVGFTGLGFDDTTITTEVYNTSDFNLLSERNFDYIFVHGFLLRDFNSRFNKNFNISEIKKLKIKTKEFIIDYSGEGYSIMQDYNTIQQGLSIFNYDTLKIITPLDNIDYLEKKYPHISFFKTPTPGLRFFASPYNHMLHECMLDIYEQNFNKQKGRFVYYGLEWSDNKKENLFMCLNNREDVHRAFLVKDILDYGLDSCSILTCNFGGDFKREYDLYHNHQKIKTQTIELDKISLNDNIENRFSANFNYSKNSYIDVITETYPRELMFITEKTVKPFFNLQFPIIFGPSGIIQQLRDYGFDMFDDIINHDYDDYGFELNPDSAYFIQQWNLFLYNKSKKIVEELKTLSTLDFHKIYLESKERLLYNQELIRKICIDENNLLFDMGDYIFGDSIMYCYEPTLQRHTY